MDENTAIKISNVSKDFVLPHEKKTSVKSVFTGLFRNRGKPTRQHALKNIDFEIKKGEFFGIVGRNGSGKSTLLKIIAGIYQPTRGKVQVDGKLVPFIELGVGFNPELTGRENVYLNGAILGFSREQIDKNYQTIVDFAELDAFMDQKLKNYSSGMQVRLAFACATMAKADILLVDEVLAVGDADFQRKCFDYFKKLKKDKKTVVFVTHDMNAVKEYCDKALLIDGSEVKSIDRPQNIAEIYTKLFNSDDRDMASVVDSKRWGNHKLEFVKPPAVKFIKDEIRIVVEVVANESVSRPVFGFHIENAAGQSILGTNSKIIEYPVELVEAGKRLKITWALENIFSDGKYTVSVACVEQNLITVIDWWKSAVSFRVTNPVTTPYPVSPSIDLGIDLK